MNLVRLIFAALFISIFFILFTAPISSCTKTETEIIHDTTTVIQKDTIVVTDSVVDSVINLNDGLIAYYNFNNGSLNDGSGYGNNIVFNNATSTADRHGVANNAFLFNGTSSYMRVPNSVSLNPRNITIMAIFKPNGYYLGTCHGNEILGKGTPDGQVGQYGMRIADFDNPLRCSTPADTSNETISVFVTQAGGQASTPVISAGQWYNVIFTYDGIVANVYFDGQLKQTWNTGPLSFSPNSNDLFIGRHEDNTNQYPYWFNGVIDEIRIYNRALPIEAIKELSQ
jgi:hypothetical protein